jgi:hypothetical protein
MMSAERSCLTPRASDKATFGWLPPRLELCRKASGVRTQWIGFALEAAPTARKILEPESGAMDELDLHLNRFYKMPGSDVQTG